MKCQNSGYQCPWAETLEEPIFLYSFILKNNVVSFYHKEQLLWRSWGAPAASERGIFSALYLHAKYQVITSKSLQHHDSEQNSSILKHQQYT